MKWSIPANSLPKELPFFGIRKRKILPEKVFFSCFIFSPNDFPHALYGLDCPKRQQDTTYNIQQKTRHMSRHYWDIYTTYDIEFLRRKKWKKIVKRNFFQNFKFFYIKLPNVICCIQCHDMCCLLDVFCCILMSWHMLRHWTV